MVSNLWGFGWCDQSLMKQVNRANKEKVVDVLVKFHLSSVELE